MAVVIVYVLFVVYLLIRGENAIGRVAEKLVPVMCCAYLLATVVILLMNIPYVPTMFVEIFKGASPAQRLWAVLQGPLSL